MEPYSTWFEPELLMAPVLSSCYTKRSTVWLAFSATLHKPTHGWASDLTSPSQERVSPIWTATSPTILDFVFSLQFDTVDSAARKPQRLPVGSHHGRGALAIDFLLDSISTVSSWYSIPTVNVLPLLKSIGLGVSASKLLSPPPPLLRSVSIERWTSCGRDLFYSSVNSTNRRRYHDKQAFN